MNDRDTFAELRQKLDGNDPFMTGGHGIKKIRRQSRPVPEWTRDDKKVQEVLLRSFPKLATDEKQRKRAATWMRVIHLYYRMGTTYSQVAAEMQTDNGRVYNIIRRIQRVAKGRRADNTGMLGKPKGRPRRKSMT